MKRKKHKKAPAPTAHLPDWQAQAASKGWPEEDIRALESILALSAPSGSCEERVVEVEPWHLSLMTIARMTFAGTDRDEKTSEHSVEYVRRRKWHRSHRAASKIERGDEQASWCSVHGTGCDPRGGECGLAGLITFELCNCPGTGKHHDKDCEAGKIAAQLEADQTRKRIMAMVEPAMPFDDSIASAKPATAAPVAGKKQKRGAALPGQLALAMPIVPPAHRPSG